MITALQFLLSLSLLIVLHEMGHFVAARAFKTRVEKFYLFFDPWFSLFKVKRGDTEYGIGWLPLGGYVKISGMVDESMDKEQLKQPPQPWEFRTKPAWQRLIIMLGGIIVNFILGLLIFGFVLLIWGKQTLPIANAKYGTAFDSLAIKAGFQDGDIVTRIGNKDLKTIDGGTVAKEIVLWDVRNATVLRNGQTVDINISDSLAYQMAGMRKGGLLDPRIPFVVSEITKDKPAEKVGFMVGDSLVAVNSDSTLFSVQRFIDVFRRNKEKEILITVARGGAMVDMKVTPDKNGEIGLRFKSPNKILKYEKKTYGFFDAMGSGAVWGMSFLRDNARGFAQLFRGKVDPNKSFGGFVSIAKMYNTPEWDWKQFWLNTGLLSLVLAFMNLLPIPALDGGHVVFLLIEMITGKKIPEKFLEYAQMVGIVLLFGLMLYANGLDIFRLFKGG